MCCDRALAPWVASTVSPPSRMRMHTLEHAHSLYVSFLSSIGRGNIEAASDATAKLQYLKRVGHSPHQPPRACVRASVRVRAWLHARMPAPSPALVFAWRTRACKLGILDTARCGVLSHDCTSMTCAGDLLGDSIDVE
jgi:hypothetical protein